MDNEVIKELRLTNELLKLISDQLELQFLQQFVNDDSTNAIRLAERNEMRTAVFEKRKDLGLEE